VPLVTALAGVVRQGDLDLLDSLNKRVGDELAARSGGRVWARTFGNGSITQRQGNVTSPEVDGSNRGMQVGVDLFRSTQNDGARGDVGFYVGRVQAKAEVSGMTGATAAPAWVGALRPETSTLGVYWTHHAASGVYVDTVAQHSWYSGDLNAVTGVSASIGGTGLLGSLELGYRHPLGPRWTLEPQAQLIGQRASLDDIAIPNASVSFDDQLTTTARLGLRLVGDYVNAGQQWKPYLRANLWHGFDDTQSTVFRTAAVATSIQTQTGYDSGEAGLGFTLALSDGVILYGELDHVFSIGGDANRFSKGVSGSVGVRINW
jgi:outer membrane autotransporter protein